MLNLKDFLESNQISTTYEEHDKFRGKKLLLKMFAPIKDIIYIFRDSYVESSVFNPFEVKNLRFFGIYNNINKKFYFDDFYKSEFLQYNKDYGVIDISDLYSLNLNDLLSEITNEVNNKIREKINNDETKLNVNLDKRSLDTNYIKRMGEEIFIKSEEFDINSYAYFEMNTKEYFNELLEYMKDKNNTIEKLANSFINENKDDIYFIIVSNKIIANHLRTICNNEEFIKLKNLNTIFSNKNLKTLNIKYKKNIYDMTFKIKNGATLNGLSDSISSYNIKPSSDRKLFEKIFTDEENEYGNILPKYIEEITYGKNIYYKNDSLN